MAEIILPAKFEAQAQQFRMDILKLAGDRNLDSAVVVCALADAVATVAVSLDRHTGERTLDDRLQSFYQRAEQTYHRTHGIAALQPRDY